MDSREEEEEEEMSIYLKVIKTVVLKVKKSETIRNLKSIIHEKEGISEHLQELFFTGEQLKDDKKLVDYGIQTNSTLHLVFQNFGLVKIFVNIPSYEKTFQLEAKTYDTIQNIKYLIQEKEGIQSDCYTLFYCGKLLEDNMNLDSLKIKVGSTLYLVFNPRDVLSIFVKMLTGETVKPEVKFLHTISDVKAIIGSTVGYSVRDQNLTYAGKQLLDWKTLASYNISENFILEMVPPTFPIFVKDLNGKTVTLVVSQQDTVTDVKSKIFNKLHVPVKVQSLVFAGRVLEDDQCLAGYKIQKDSTLHMVLWPSTLVQKMKFSDIGGQVHLLPRFTTIRNLKAAIQKVLEKPVKEVLIKGSVLQDHLSLDHYAIKSDTRLMIALEIR